LLSRFADTTNVPDDRVWIALADELVYTARGAQLLVPGPIRDPELAAVVTYRDRLDVLVLGPAKGTALAVEGAARELVGLANVVLIVPQELAGYPFGGVYYLEAPQFVSNDVFFPTPAQTADTSRFLGGNAILILSIEGRAAVGAYSVLGEAPLSTISRSARAGTPVRDVLREVRYVGGRPVAVLEAGFDVVIAPGTTGIRNTMSQLTAATGREIGLLTAR
jgi:hypothetical protein